MKEKLRQEEKSLKKPQGSLSYVDKSRLAFIIVFRLALCPGDDLFLTLAQIDNVSTNPNMPDIALLQKPVKVITVFEEDPTSKDL